MLNPWRGRATVCGGADLHCFVQIISGPDGRDHDDDELEPEEPVADRLTAGRVKHAVLAMRPRAVLGD